jgi:diguanylate cyclase (GGDEF)-like protein/PAS domain S-box-containing protein
VQAVQRGPSTVDTPIVDSAGVGEQRRQANRAAGWPGVLAALRSHPGARLNAVDESGLFVPLPPGMEGTGYPQVLAGSGIELVEPEDHGELINSWLDVLTVGHGMAEVRDRTHPLHLTKVEFFDVRPEFGVLAAVGYPTVPRAAASVAPLPGEQTREAPRVGRVRKDQVGVLVAVDEDAEQMLGYPPGSLLGVGARDLVHPDDQGLAVSAWIGLLERPGGQGRVRLRKRRADGSWLWLDVTNHNRLDDPAYGCVVADLVDVSREMAFREDIRARERLLQRLTQALPVGVVQLSPTGEVLYSNERLHQVLGGPARSSFDELLETLRPGDRARMMTSFSMAVLAGQDDDLQVEVQGAALHRVLDVSLRPLVDDAGIVEGVIVCLHDVTEDVRLRAELEERATHDGLTGCLNRSAVLRRLEEELRRMSPGHGCAVLFLDLDEFKHVNDTRGHAAGDKVLREVAAVLRSAARTGDAVGRLGGDEFVLVCPRIESAASALALAVDVQARLRRSQPVGSDIWTASTGVAWVDDPALDAERVLGRADAAMYDAKQDRRQTAVLWAAPEAAPAPAPAPGVGGQAVIGRQPRADEVAARSSPPAART